MIRKKLKNNLTASAFLDNTGVSGDINQLKVAVSQNTQNIQTNTESIEQLELDYGSLVDKVNANEQSIANLPTREYVDQQDNEIRASVEGFDTRIQQNTDAIDALEQDYGSLVQKVNTNEANILNKADTSYVDTQDSALSARIDSIDNNIPNFARKDQDNVFTANNTFNSGIRVSTNGFNVSGGEISIAQMNLQTQKKMNFDYVQSSGDYKNYCNFNIRYKHRNADFIDLLSFEFRPHDNEGIFVRTNLNFINWSGKKLTNIANPTANQDAANKQYVDNKVSTIDLSNYYNKSESDNKFGLKTNVQQNTTNIEAVGGRVGVLEDSLRDANIMLYVGEWNAQTTYKLAQTVSHNDKWYSSSVNNNQGHEPIGESDQYWKIISGPTVSLENYYTKTESDSKFGLKTSVDQNTQAIEAINTDLDNNYYTGEQIDALITPIKDLADTNQAEIRTLNSELATTNNKFNEYYKATETDAKYATKAEIANVAKTNVDNTFTGSNVFRNMVRFTGTGSNTNKGGYVSNFDYEGANYSAFKLSNGDTNLLQIQVNNNNNYALISTPNGNNLTISGLRNPTENSEATNKQYVDTQIGSVKEQNYEGYGEKLTNEKFNGKPVYIYLFNPNQELSLPSSGGFIIAQNVDLVIDDNVWIWNPFENWNIWYQLPTRKRNQADFDIHYEITENNSLRIGNWAIIGNRKFKGFIKYTKLS